MIGEFSVKPKPSNNKARLCFAISMALAFALIAISTFIKAYSGIFSLLGICALTLSLLVFTKYISPAYFYDVTTDSDGMPLFVVRQQIGKRHTTLCRIGLCEVVGVRKESAKERRSHKTPSDTVRYSYLPTLDPAESYRITTSGRYERAEILIECSDDFASFLSAYSAEARERHGLDDEY